MTLLPVASIGSRETTAMVHGRMTAVTELVYPPSRGSDLRTAREAAGITLRRCAALLGITAAELTSLEIGRVTVADEEWARALAQIEASAAKSR